jgi:hypothetical protein
LVDDTSMAINVNKMMTDEAKTANHSRIRKLLTLEKKQQLLLSNVFKLHINKLRDCDILRLRQEHTASIISGRHNALFNLIKQIDNLYINDMK